MRRKRKEEVREEKGRGRWGREAGRIGGEGTGGERLYPPSLC